ncbi:hypothetical protein FZEAL_3309 [Fusarium zealandicum]|uniref:WSC domain-containing protein n=1 Tax=Fusarium zealandicum TaxID=1053134 RepID=A0A8H4UPK1_9HYPO|nr:hypothetical protein FZEAL_3309 [Fusarium zealandicum]
MLIYLLIALFGIAVTFGQATYGSESFKYWGCATVDAAGFDGPIQLPNGLLSPKSCQTACAGYMFAAISPNACRCGNDPEAIKAVEEGSCNHPCSEYPNSPMCGGTCPEGTPSISNLFIIDSTLLRDEDTLPDPDSLENTPVPSNDTPFLPPLEQSAASDALSEETSVPPRDTPPLESQITQAPPLSTDILQPPTETTGPILPSASVPLEPPGSIIADEPEPVLPMTPTTSPSTATLPLDNPPVTPATGSSTATWVAPGIPPEASAGSTTETLVTDTLAIPSMTPTEDDEPVPSQVTTSDSSQFEIPVLTALGELLLIAVMVV